MKRRPRAVAVQMETGKKKSERITTAPTVAQRLTGHGGGSVLNQSHNRCR